MDPRSMVAFLDMRKLLVKVGHRFAMRIQFYAANYIGMMLGISLLIFLNQIG
jgi:hypothetical protein